MCLKSHYAYKIVNIVCEIAHCGKVTLFSRSKNYSQSKIIHTSTATDATDKYQVWLRVLFLENGFGAWPSNWQLWLLSDCS